MELACNDVVPGLGCDYVAKAETAEMVHGAMMAHGGATHASLMDGMTTDEMQKAKEEMDTHISSLLAKTG